MCSPAMVSPATASSDLADVISIIRGAAAPEEDIAAAVAAVSGLQEVGTCHCRGKDLTL